MTKNIKFNTNKEAIGLLDNLKGSIENKIRTAYNLGYKDGFKEGASKTAKKMLDRLLEDIEPKDEPQTEVVMPYERMRGLYTGYRKTEPTISKMEQVEDEPRTERSE